MNSCFYCNSTNTTYLKTQIGKWDPWGYKTDQHIHICNSCKKRFRTIESTYKEDKEIKYYCNNCKKQIKKFRRTCKKFLLPIGENKYKKVDPSTYGVNLILKKDYCNECYLTEIKKVLSTIQEVTK